MSQYAMTYEQLGAMPSTRFEEVWKAYNTRTALNRLEAEIARQRSSIESSMGTKEEIESAVEKLEAWANDTRRYILDMDKPDRSDDQEVPEVPGEFRQDLWWKPKPEETAALTEKKILRVEDTGIDSEGHLGFFEPEVEVEE